MHTGAMIRLSFLLIILLTETVTTSRDHPIQTSNNAQSASVCLIVLNPDQHLLELYACLYVTRLRLRATFASF